jgi:hypothetical protein
MTTPVDPSFLHRLEALLHDEVGPWLDQISREVKSGDLPADCAIVGTWAAPDPFGDVANVDATVDGARTTVTVSLRSGQVIATTTAR